MLIALFVLAAVILVGSVIRPPQALWQKAIVLFAVIVLLAVCVAWGLEYLAGGTRPDSP